MAAARRRHVFVGKVLKRLFPREPRDQDERTPPPPPAAPEAAPERARCQRVPPVAGGGTEAPPRGRLYTAALPPEGYVPAPVPQEPLGSGSESTCSGEEEEDTGDQDPHDQPKRRRRRKQKTRRTLEPNTVHVEPAESERQQASPQETSQPCHTGEPTMSKNKKRKLKKKQQLKRKKAAGFLTKASGISFLYEPREDGCELGNAGDAGAAGDTGDSEAGEAGGAGAGVQDDADGILEFLKSTQEMYLYDGVSQDPDPAFLGAAEALFTGLEARSVCAADLLGLEQLKALLLLQDPARLQRALQAFAEHCAMPPDQAGVVSVLFGYWATHMFPERSREGARGPWLPGAGAPQGASGSLGGPAGPREDGAP